MIEKILIFVGGFLGLNVLHIFMIKMGILMLIGYFFITALMGD